MQNNPRCSGPSPRCAKAACHGGRAVGCWGARSHCPARSSAGVGASRTGLGLQVLQGWTNQERCRAAKASATHPAWRRPRPSWTPPGGCTGPPARTARWPQPAAASCLHVGRRGWGGGWGCSGSACKQTQGMYDMARLGRSYSAGLAGRREPADLPPPRMHTLPNTCTHAHTRTRNPPPSHTESFPHAPRTRVELQGGQRPDKVCEVLARDVGGAVGRGQARPHLLRDGPHQVLRQRGERVW